MKQGDFLKKYVVLFFLFLFIGGGCKKSIFEGEDKILGTATINGKEYKETIRWGLTFQGYTSSLKLYQNYRIARFIVRLKPLDGVGPSYSIYYYISMDENKFSTNYPYKLEFIEDLEVESYDEFHVLPYLSENKTEILTDGVDGIVVVFTSNLDDPIPVKGEIVLERIESRISYGHYSFNSLNKDQEKIEIKGKFETSTVISNFEFKKYNYESNK